VKLLPEDVTLAMPEAVMVGAITGGNATVLPAGPTVSVLPDMPRVGVTFVDTVPEVNRPVAGLYDGIGASTVKLLPAVVIEITPEEIRVGTAAAGKLMVFVGGPTVSVLPEMPRVWVMFVTAVPVVNAPEAEL